MGFDIFLKPLAPPDPSIPLSHTDENILRQKNFWLNSSGPEQLSKIVSQIIADRAGSPITNVVCLGLGAYFGDGVKDNDQFVAFSQIVQQLSLTYPNIRDNIYVQDPGMKQEIGDVFESLGFCVVEDPEAFSEIGSGTLLFNWFVPIFLLLGGMRKQRVREVPVYVGPDIRSFIELYEKSKGMITAGIPDKDRAEFTFMAQAMLDLRTCCRVPMPCDPPTGSETNFAGLNSLDIWWRPVKQSE